MRHIKNKINVSVESNFKPWGKEKSLYKRTHMQNQHKEQKVQIVFSGWNIVVRTVIATTRIIKLFFKHHMCHGFEVDNRLG